MQRHGQCHEAGYNDTAFADCHCGATRKLELGGLVFSASSPHADAPSLAKTNSQTPTTQQLQPNLIVKVDTYSSDARLARRVGAGYGRVNILIRHYL